MSPLSYSGASMDLGNGTSGEIGMVAPTMSADDVGRNQSNGGVDCSVNDSGGDNSSQTNGKAMALMVQPSIDYGEYCEPGLAFTRTNMFERVH